MRKVLILVPALLAAVAGCGVSGGLLWLSDLFGKASDGLGLAGTCLSPAEPIDLSGVFAHAVPVAWDGNSVELTDAAQPDVEAFFLEHLGRDVPQAYYLSERFCQLGPMAAGEVLQVECLADVPYGMWLYDAEYTLLAAWEAHDFQGDTPIREIPILWDSPSVFMRVALIYLSETGDGIVRLTREPEQTETSPHPQTVVLHFSGATGLTYRSGAVPLTDVSPLEGRAVRDAVVRTFKDTFSQFNLTVLTDQDPAPSTPASRIYIGHANPPLHSANGLGLAELVDNGNRVQDDVAIVDAGQAYLGLARLLGYQVYGTAIGKIAAHEMGHLLGLWHVVDADALMTGVGCLGTGVDLQGLLNRGFKKAPVQAIVTDTSTEVLGYQDAVGYLLEILGPASSTQP